VLAYVFWHTPGPDGDIGTYERALGAFHRALAAAAPPGFHRSAAHALDGANWLPGRGYEDWYAVDDWAALGTLNDAALDARRRGPHDSVAAAARGGAGGVYRLRAGDPSIGAGGPALWLAKPDGVPYEEVRERLARLVSGHGGVWERQLALGPAPEYCIAAAGGAASAPMAAAVVQRRPVFGGAV
jgi:hypothetical protein